MRGQPAAAKIHKKLAIFLLFSLPLPALAPGTVPALSNEQTTHKRGDRIMLSFIIQSGFPTTVVDLTTDLSSLLVGLVALTALAADMIAVAAIRYHVALQAE